MFSWELLRGQEGANRARSEKDQSKYVYIYLAGKYNPRLVRIHIRALMSLHLPSERCFIGLPTGLQYTR